ncbi:MAG TPA: hypothetical protein VGN72_19985 [Tepidisphaeraceae bacterium]|jgi:hypothetical protein|nr:hypothetical protein [Tepidisphaeraceae bacterium]
MPKVSDEREAVQDTLTPAMTAEVWTANYGFALPFTLQDFRIGAVLPAMLYMARWGHRRGRGGFAETFRRAQGERPTIDDVAHKLVGDEQYFAGFTSDSARAILGDLLLAFCLENSKHKLGRREQVQRVFPTHYFASWIDLPDSIANLRNVPEMLTSLLANQKNGTQITIGDNGKTRFPVGVGLEKNLLLDLLGKGLILDGLASNLTADRFDESAFVGVDQLLTIRAALACKGAPEKLRAGARSSGPEIPNQHPLARRAADELRDGLRLFISGYGRSVPRRSLLPMLEVSMGIGLTNLMLSTLGLLETWQRTGRVPGRDEQQAWPLFVDCSNSADPDLRRVSETSTEECFRHVANMPVILMCLRILGYRARFDRHLKQVTPEPRPDATEWVNLLGEIVHDRHARSESVLNDLSEKCDVLAEKLDEKGIGQVASDVLRSTAQPNPAWRLAEALTLLMGDKLQRQQLRTALDSCLMLNEEHGIARSRRVAARSAGSSRRTEEVHSIVLSNTALDYLVHRHLCKSVAGGSVKVRQVSLSDFVAVLRDRYGFHIDVAPPGMSISQELLLRNRQILERRLRDLGVLVGVNDAESMKRLKPRFQPAGGDHE